VPERIFVVGVLGDVTGADLAGQHFDVVAGGARHLERWGSCGARHIVMGGDGCSVDDAITAIGEERGTVGVLASGDPGFFGIVRALAVRFGPDMLDVRPAPSSVAVAFARVGLPWDDAAVVSAHGRFDELAGVYAAAVAPKVAVLCSPTAPPNAVAKVIATNGGRFDHAAVAARLGEADESVTVGTLDDVVHGTFDPLSVLLLWRGDGVAAVPVTGWATPESGFLHRGGMITKAEVRAVVLSKIGAIPGQLLWDVGAGSGSVGIETAVLVPGLRVIAVERERDACGAIGANAAARHVAVDVVHGVAPAALADLPQPDRVFVGGGGLPVLDAVLKRLHPSGRVVATYAALDRAAAAYERLGSLVQVSVARGEPLASGVRLAPLDPVFVCWGPPHA
jgi:precorrin-6Y C5,15-methyltransferase (decarboxylating)